MKLPTTTTLLMTAACCLLLPSLAAAHPGHLHAPRGIRAPSVRPPVAHRMLRRGSCRGRVERYRRGRVAAGLCVRGLRQGLWRAYDGRGRHIGSARYHRGVRVQAGSHLGGVHRWARPNRRWIRSSNRRLRRWNHAPLRGHVRGARDVRGCGHRAPPGAWVHYRHDGETVRERARRLGRRGGS